MSGFQSYLLQSTLRSTIQKWGGYPIVSPLRGSKRVRRQSRILLRQAANCLALDPFCAILRDPGEHGPSRLCSCQHAHMHSLAHPCLASHICLSEREGGPLLTSLAGLVLSSSIAQLAQSAEKRSRRYLLNECTSINA